MEPRKHISLAELAANTSHSQKILHMRHLSQGYRPEVGPMPLAMPPAAEAPDTSAPDQQDAAHTKLLFDQAARLPKIKIYGGPLMPAITDVMNRLASTWYDRHPNLEQYEVSELTKNPNYANRALIQRIKDRHGISDDEVSSLRPARAELLNSAFTEYGSSLTSQAIPDNLLETPPYLTQPTRSGCVRACFRMIFSAIAQDKLAVPSENAITRLAEYGGDKFDEDLLFRSMSTEYFARHTGKLVVNRLFIGADYNLIAHKVARIKQQYPAAQAYAVTTQQSFTVEVWDRLHACVVLAADEQTVAIHNPTPRIHTEDCNTKSLTEQCGAQEQAEKLDYSKRWGLGLHRVNIVVALPL